MKLKKLGILFFPSLLGAVFLGGIPLGIATLHASAGAENVVQAILPGEEPTKTSQTNAPPLQGYWKLDVNVRGQTHSGSKANYEIMAYFNQIGSELSGQFVRTSGSACKETSISGTVQGGKVNWTAFYTGSCCGGARVKFEDVLRSPNIVEGKLSPVGDTPVGCTLWWADVVSTKQDYYHRR